MRGSHGTGAWIAPLCALVTGGGTLAVHAATGRLLPPLLLLGAAGLIAWGVARRLAARAPVDIEDALEAMVRGDLAPGRSLPSSPLSDVVQRLAARLEAERARREERRTRLAAWPAALQEAASRVGHSSDQQMERIRGAGDHVADLRNTIHDITADVERLHTSNEETATSIEQMSAAVEQMAGNAAALSKTVEASNGSIQQMGASIRRVADTTEEVDQVAGETATAAVQMDRALQEMGGHVRGAADLTRRVSDSAEQGSDAVGETIRGIEAIRARSQEARRAVETLAGRIGEIGEIATVIGGISEETRLLSLNAAIIASQAGEHGRAFGVVADQVKTLSSRTQTSARQIEEMIQAVQRESELAVEAMGAGIDAVQEGVTRSKLAGESLRTIRSSAHQASGQVAEIERAAEEQARGSKHVAAAAQKVSDCVREISQAMSEQSAAGQSLARHVTTYLDMAKQMALAAEEQRTTSRYIAEHSRAATDRIRRIAESTAAHETASDAVARHLESLRTALVETASDAPELVALADQMTRFASEDAPSSAAESAA